MSSKKQLAKIIENMINVNKNEPIQVVSGNNETTVELSRLLGLIESKKLQPVGNGYFKTCYREGNIAILLETVYLASSSISSAEFFKQKDIVDILIDLGVQTPKFLDFACFSNGKKHKVINTQEFVDGRPLFKFKNYTTPNEDQNEIDKQFEKYNLATIKERVAWGEPFIEKYIENFNILHPLNLLHDAHGENIIFNPKTGYHFIDLGFSTAPNFATAEEAKNLLLNPVTPELFKILENRTYLGTNASYKDQAKFIFCFTNLNPTSYSNLSENFPFFVYNGILAQQFDNCVAKMNNLPPNFSVGETAPKYPFALNHYDLERLYHALKTQDNSSLDLFKFAFGLPNSYDFNKELDSNFFINVMENSIINTVSDEDHSEMWSSL